MGNEEEKAGQVSDNEDVKENAPEAEKAIVKSEENEVKDSEKSNESDPSEIVELVENMPPEMRTLFLHRNTTFQARIRCARQHPPAAFF